MSSFIDRYVIGGTSPDESDADDHNYNVATATITELEMELQAVERQRVAQRRSGSRNNITDDDYDLHEADSNDDDDDDTTTPQLDSDEALLPTEGRSGGPFPTSSTTTIQLPIRGSVGVGFGGGGRSRASSGVSSSAPEMRTCQGTPIASFTSTPRGPTGHHHHDGGDRQYSIPSSYNGGGSSSARGSPPNHIPQYPLNDNDNDVDGDHDDDEECRHVGRERPSQFTLQDGGSDMYPQQQQQQGGGAGVGNFELPSLSEGDVDPNDPDSMANMQAMLQQLRDAMAEVEDSAEEGDRSDKEERTSNEGSIPQPNHHDVDQQNYPNSTRDDDKNSGGGGDDDESPPHEARTPSASHTPRRSVSAASSSSTLHLGSEGRQDTSIISTSRRSPPHREDDGNNNVDGGGNPSRSASVVSATGIILAVADDHHQSNSSVAASRSPSASLQCSHSASSSSAAGGGSFTNNGSLSLPDVATPSDIARSPAPSDLEVPPPRRQSSASRHGGVYDDAMDGTTPTTTTTNATALPSVHITPAPEDADAEDDEAADTQTYHDGLPTLPTPTREDHPPVLAEDITTTTTGAGSGNDLDAVVSTTADILLGLSTITPTHHQQHQDSIPLPYCTEDADIVSTTADLLLRLGGCTPRRGVDGCDKDGSSSGVTQRRWQVGDTTTAAPSAGSELAELMAKYGVESTTAAPKTTSPSIAAAAATSSRSVSQTSHPEIEAKHSRSNTAISNPATSMGEDGEEFEAIKSTFQISQSVAAIVDDDSNTDGGGSRSTVVSGRASLETSFTKMTSVGGRSRSGTVTSQTAVRQHHQQHSANTSPVIASQPMSRQLSTAAEAPATAQGTANSVVEGIGSRPRSNTSLSNTSIGGGGGHTTNHNLSIDEPMMMEEQSAAVRMSLEADNDPSRSPSLRELELGLSQRSEYNPISTSPNVPPVTTPTPTPIHQHRRISAPTDSSIHQFLPSATTPLRTPTQAIVDGEEVSRDLESYLNDRSSAPVGITHHHNNNMDISQISAIVAHSPEAAIKTTTTTTRGHPSSYSYNPTVPSSNASNQRIEISRPTTTTTYGIQGPDSSSTGMRVGSRGEEEARRLITPTGDVSSRSYLEKSLSLLDTLPTPNTKTYTHPSLRVGVGSPSSPRRPVSAATHRQSHLNHNNIMDDVQHSQQHHYPVVIEADISPVYGSGVSTSQRQSRYSTNNNNAYTSPSRGDNNALLMNVRVPRATSQTHTSMYTSPGVIDISPWDGNNIRHLPPGDTSSHVGGGRNIYGYPSGTQHISNPVQYLVYEQKRRALLAQHDTQANDKDDGADVIAEIDEASHYIEAMRAALRSKDDGSTDCHQSPPITSPLAAITPAQAAAAARSNIMSTPSRVDKAEGSSYVRVPQPSGTLDAESSLTRSASSPQAVPPQRPTQTPISTGNDAPSDHHHQHQQPVVLSQQEIMRQEALDRIHTFRTHQGMATPHSNHRPQNTPTTATTGLNNDEPSRHMSVGGGIVDPNHPGAAYFNRMMAASYERLASPRCLQRDIPTAGVASSNNVEDSTRLMETLHTGAAIEGHYGPGQRSMVRAAATLPSAAEQQVSAARLEARQRVESMANDPVVRRIAEEMRLEDESRMVAPTTPTSVTTPTSASRTVPQNNTTTTTTTVSSEIKSLPRRPGTTSSITSTPRHTQRRLMAPSPPREVDDGDSNRYYSPAPAGLVNSVAVTHYSSSGRTAARQPPAPSSPYTPTSHHQRHPQQHESRFNNGAEEEQEAAGSGPYVDVWSDSFKMKWRSTSEHYKRMLGTLPEHQRIQGPNDTFTTHTSPMSMRVGGGGARMGEGISMTSPHAYGRDNSSSTTGLTPEGYMTVAYRNALTDAYASSNTHTHYSTTRDHHHHHPTTSNTTNTSNTTTPSGLNGVVDEMFYITKMRELTAYRSSMGADRAFINGE